MQQGIATAQNSSASENPFLQACRSALSWLWSMLVTLGLSTASLLYRVFERFDSGTSDSINIDRVAARLDVLERARTDGTNEYPPSGEEAVSGAQREIIAHFKELQRRAQRRISILADKLRKIRETIDLAGLESKLQDIPSRCENDVLRMIADSQSRLNSYRDVAVQHAQTQSQDEETRHGIPVFLQLAFLAVLFGAASVLVTKTPVFEPGVPSPTPPPWVLITLLSVVLLSATAALGASSSISPHGALWKLRKWLRAGTGIVFVALTSLLASHYLLAMAADPDTALSSVFSGLLVERTLPLLSIADWTVFSIVLIAGLLAFAVCYQPEIEAYEADDSHSTGHRSRKKLELLARKLRQQVNAKIDQAEADVSATLKRPKSAIGKYARLVDESRRLPARLNDYDLVLEDACNVLLDRYRAENAKMRTTAMPHSFHEHVCFRPEYETSLSTLSDEGRRLEEFQQGLDKLESQAGQVRQKLRDLNSRAINTLDEIAAS